MDSTVDLVITRLNEMDMWFTTESDPVDLADTYVELDEYGFPTDIASERIDKEVKDLIGDGAIDIEDAVEMWIVNATQKNQVYFKDYLKTKFKDKEVVKDIEAFENPIQSTNNLQESAKQRLKEQNTQSLDLINDKMSSSDINTKEGKLISKTLELFNALSNKGYDVKVTFDNGESQSVVLIGEQGAKAISTITNGDKPVKVFASGNFEITDSILDTLKDIKQVSESL